MRILLINVAHPAIGSRIPREHLPPLGLLCIGGPLIDAGHEVELLDGELKPLSGAEIVAEAVCRARDAVLFGHSGSSSGHPIIAQTAALIRHQLPEAKIIYGGVHPTYHWREILCDEPAVDVIVRGEGEATGVALIEALQRRIPLSDIPGLASKARPTPPRRRR